MAISKDILRQYADLKQEIKEMRQRIEKLERQIEDIVLNGTVKDTVTGGLGGIQHFTIEGIAVPEYAKKQRILLSRKLRLQQMENELDVMVGEVEEFILDIPDSRIRRIITMRFLDGMTWNEVADHIGGMNTEDSVKKMFYRYMESNK